MSMPAHHLIMKTAENWAEIPREQLGAPGAPRAITILAIMENETRDDSARLQDQSLRTFDVEVLLTKQLTFPDTINGAFTKEDGTSLVKAATDIAMMKFDTTFGSFNIELNSRNEFALIRMKVEARVPREARNKVYDATAPFLDYLSYLAQAPILTGLMKIYDNINQATTIDIVGPEREVILNPGVEHLFFELAPIYALYREFKNSSSAYYRLLCLFKVMEGILGELRKRGREQAKVLDIPFSMPKERVPDHPDIAKDLRYLIGMPIKQFYDKILEKRFRDAASHFLVRENVILQVSSAEERNRFAEMAFVCELSARVLISNHEELLRRLDEARRAQAI
ncbi:MAG: methylamine utilization protein MauJ [Beijerinckiaceae bacterium]